MIPTAAFPQFPVGPIDRKLENDARGSQFSFITCSNNTPHRFCGDSIQKPFVNHWNASDMRMLLMPLSAGPTGKSCPAGLVGCLDQFDMECQEDVSFEVDSAKQAYSARFGSMRFPFKLLPRKPPK